MQVTYNYSQSSTLSSTLLSSRFDMVIFLYQVENRISRFRDMLYKKLMELPSTVEEQKKLIRFLVHLETPGDPAWECLVNMQKWLIQVTYRNICYL